ncbi:D-alanyl-D-alanine carboxypeptidase family protein [Anaerococcus sp. Marseille-P9784]|uniref:M15 family metallopeptidase n=1 Tax=Anaerococcus sp. Marseille-P9784 TaxID=2614127 RepID=UPI00124AC667|nr:M15 family metallopeptidase [Anaerococcus sp. Marseille-P9784]
MSNIGIREKKRKNERRRKARNKKIFSRSVLAALAMAGIFHFGFNNPKDQFQIERPVEYRQASGSINNIIEEAHENTTEMDAHVATQIGFDDAKVDEKLQVADDMYSDNLKEYLLCTKTQYAYQYPNDYSKTEKFIKEGTYVASYGTENGFTKIKINDAYYYVNKFGLSKLDSGRQIKIINGLVYVSEEYPLPEDFDPGVDKTAKRAFETMRQDMEREGLDIKIASDYRSYDLERKMYDAGEIESTVPGCNEHQLGCAFDFFTEGTKYNDKFEKTAEYKWLSENAYKYGFIERYPSGKEDKTNHVAYSWHFRFVGVANAKEIYENDLTLEEYLKIY